MEGVLQVGKEALAWSYNDPQHFSEHSKALLVLHGAGQSTQDRTAYLVEPLIQAGHSIFRFDYSGHGQSSGTILEGSLARRYSETLAMLQQLKSLAPNLPIVVSGSSMGAHTATLLAHSQNLAGLILVVPAAYTAAAEHMYYGPEFKAVISAPQSWLNSPVWSTLNTFTKPVFLITAGQDDIIPPEVLQLYRQRAKNLNELHVPEAPHAFHKWLENNPTRRYEFITKLIEFLNAA